MAFDSYNAALAGYFASNLQLDGSVPIDSRTTGCTISRDITQAATVTVTVEDSDRSVLNSSVANRQSRLAVGPISFWLVKVGKRANQTILTFEDSIIARLRTIKGPLAAAPGVVTRVQFAQQLCRTAGVPFIGSPPGPLAKEPLARGTTQDPQEDTWTCLTRLAQDVGYRCYSDGTSVLFGPDDWWFTAAPTMTIAEYTGGVDLIDITDWDIGKPLAETTVYTYAPIWHGDLGAIIQVTGLGPASRTWMVARIDRDLFHTACTIQLVAPQPTLPEPQNTS